VTTEADVKRGKTRIPLKLARIYDEDLICEEAGADNKSKRTSNAGMEFDDAEMADHNDIGE
jgi:hypothetical protein